MAEATAGRRADAPDLTVCDREPIHLLGRVQSFGFLLAFSSDWLVRRASTNLQAFLGIEWQQALGMHVDQLLAPRAIHEIRNRLALMSAPDSIERLLHLQLRPDHEFDVAIHVSQREIVIEGEPSAPLGHGDVALLIRTLTGRLSQLASLEDFKRRSVRHVRSITGFDRVMLYQFDDSGAGEVVAESVDYGRESYLGLHYPATDIPRQARELYVRNQLRVIADIEDPGAPIQPERDENGKPIDLSMSVLRSVSPVHVEYLRNMGVRASLSVSITAGGKLWGLFACHHYAPLRPTLDQRTAAELYGRLFSLMLESRERAETAQYEQKAREVADRFIAVVASDEEKLLDAEWIGHTIGGAIANDGVGVYVNGKAFVSGLTPSVDEFRELIRVLNRSAASDIFATDRIGNIEPTADRYSDRAAGLIAIPLSRSPRDYVVLFRAEQLRTVRWAGDPQKAMVEDAAGVRLSPRKSFEQWRQTVHGVSRPFTNVERHTAKVLRTSLLEVVLLLSEGRKSEQDRAQERQELLIAELNHRVRNILSLVRGLISQSRASAQSYEDFTATLDGRVRALARSHDQLTAHNWDSVLLSSLIEVETGAYAGRFAASRVRVNGPPVELQPLAFNTLALVIHELITNSAKYGALSDNGSIDVTWSLDSEGDLRLAWTESGGPAVQMPKRRGFGSTIIERSVPHELGGKADIHFRMTGLVAEFCIPARHVRAAAGPAVTTLAVVPQTRAKVDFPARVLLLEDSMVIALDIEEELRELGAQEVITTSSVAGAMEALRKERPDFAILDINLGTENSIPVAHELQRLGIPFVFGSGYGEQANLGGTLTSVKVVSKPYSAAEILQALTR